MRPRILFLEADAALRDAVSALLEQAGMDVTTEPDSSSLLARLAGGGVDLVLLDPAARTPDGLSLCAEIHRGLAVPMVMLSERDAVADLVAGLERGADDYVTMPFEGPELVARIRAVLRRAGNSDERAQALRFAELEIDAHGFTATRHGVPVPLTATEFRLLLELARNAGEAMSREALLERVWGYDYLGQSRLVDTAVKRLRDKIDDDASDPRHITTVRGVGYRFERT